MESIDPYLQNNGTFQVIYALSELASTTIAGSAGVIPAKRQLNLTGTYKLQLIGVQLQSRPCYGIQTGSSLTRPSDNYIAGRNITNGGLSPMFTDCYALQIASPQFVTVSNMTPDLNGFVVCPNQDINVNSLTTNGVVNNPVNNFVDVATKPVVSIGNVLGNVVTCCFTNNELNLSVFAGRTATNSRYNWTNNLYEALGGAYMRAPDDNSVISFEGNLVLTFQYQKLM